MRINKIPAEGVLEYETPQISYGSDEETNQSKPLPMPERPFVPVPSEEEDIAEDLTLNELDFDDFSNLPKPGPYVPPTEIRRAKQEIALKPEKVPGGLVPPDKRINIEIPELITDFPPDLGKPVGNYSDAS